MKNPDREQALIGAADRLMNARRTSIPIDGLPVELEPSSLEEAYFVQDQLAIEYGEIGGWKVGAPSADATPILAPMPLAWIASDGAELRGSRHLRGLEAEIAFLLGSDLPLRQEPYSPEEIVAAIASCHPAIEVLESGLADPQKAARLSMIADLQMHGGFVYGPPAQDWPRIDFTSEHAVIAVDGVIRVERTGSNTSGNLMRLLPWLANEGAARTGGLKAGQWITTGSWTGVTLAAKGSAANAKFSTAGGVQMRFA